MALQLLLISVTLRIIICHVTRMCHVVPIDDRSLGAVTTLLSSASESWDILGESHTLRGNSWTV
jgi:hypothetical protein